MDTYTKAAYLTSKLVTNEYSTSFGLSIRLFEPALRPHIYAIYGLVRIADEIVDTYKGPQAAKILDRFEKEISQALVENYSTNPIIYAYVITAQRYDIPEDLLAAFFTSMRMDLTAQTYDQQKYETYIYGSAEVVGLLCLRVFADDANLYETLADGARHLGAAYQKVNFLRDIAADHDELERWYFPEGSYNTFDEAAKAHIIAEISYDFEKGREALVQLPRSSRKAVALSYHYYQLLLKKIESTPATVLKQQRVRIPNVRKLLLLCLVAIRGR